MKTKTMKTNFKLLAITAFIGLSLNSCSEDDAPALSAPVITTFEYGEGSEHSTEPIAYLGEDIHIEADITAEATVSSITVMIHAHDIEVGEGETEWDEEFVFTDAKYLVLNPAFHEHIPVPDDAPAGEYHIEFIVTDELGNTTEVEGHIDIMGIITLSEFSIDTTAKRGEDMHTEFMIDAVNGIHSISVDIHAHDITVGDGEVEWDYENEFLGDYHEQTSVEFHEHIDIPADAPAGEYHVEFTVEDEDGNTKAYETHIDITA